MKVYQIGITSFENKESKRELKGIGGIQGYILELTNFLISKNISIGFIGKIYNYKKNETIEYFQIQNEVTSTNKFLIKLFLKSLSIKLPKNAIIHAHRPDHLAAFSFFKNRSSVISLHGQQGKTVNDRKGKVVRTIYNSLEKYALNKAKAIIAVDDITKSYYLKMYPQYANKLVVIPTGVNTKLFKPLEKKGVRDKFQFSKSDKIIVYVGRIEPPKKIREIIEAFKILSDDDPSYKLVVVGDGVLLNEMKELSTNLKVDHKISFLGVRKRSELPELFNLANISVLYSINEGSPLSIKESLACGIPVVANCVGDVTKVIKNGYNGYLVEKESIAELASKMKIAIDNSLNLKENCINSIAPFTTDNVGKTVLDLYETLIKL